MKIFYDEASNLELHNFGITIPLTDRRVQRIIDFLDSAGIPKFPIDEIDSEFELSLRWLEEVHTPNYAKAVVSNDELTEKALIDTFELFDTDGKPNRYDPSESKYPLTELAKRSLRQVRGTVLAAEQALLDGGAFFLGGGFHHAMSFGGRGFCFVNDLVLAAKYIQKTHGIKQIWIIDVDVHKGDGTAELCCNDASIKTLSIHMGNGWPLDDEVRIPDYQAHPWYIPSDVDIPILNSEEDSYIERLEAGLEKLLETGEPDFIFIAQGSDPFEKDQLPSSSQIKLSEDQMLARDKLVWDLVKKLAVPHCYVMSGGYGDFSHIPFINFFKLVHG